MKSTVTISSKIIRHPMISTIEIQNNLLPPRFIACFLSRSRIYSVAETVGRDALPKNFRLLTKVLLARRKESLRNPFAACCDHSDTASGSGWTILPGRHDRFLPSHARRRQQRSSSSERNNIRRRNAHRVRSFPTSRKPGIALQGDKGYQAAPAEKEHD